MTDETTIARMALNASLDLTAAEGLRIDLLAQLSDGGILLDGSAVENISTPCLQVLAAAAASAINLNQPFRLRHPSDVLRAAITDLGLHAAIPIED